VGPGYAAQRKEALHRVRNTKSAFQAKKQGAAGITTAALSVCDGSSTSAVIQKRHVVPMGYV
jgi:hypothetical protein